MSLETAQTKDLLITLFSLIHRSEDIRIYNIDNRISPASTKRWLITNLIKFM